MTKKKQIKSDTRYVPVVAKVSPEVKKWLVSTAADNNRTISQQLRQIISEYINAN